MNKFFLTFFPIFLFAQWINYPYILKLKKDETANFEVHSKNKIYPLKIRWTLYKNDFLILLYKYDNFPRQITLFKNYPLNTFKINLLHYPMLNPYLLIEFKDFDGKIATFEINLFNKDDIRIKRLKNGVF